jgi:hypothetical protein
MGWTEDEGTSKYLDINHIWDLSEQNRSEISAAFKRVARDVYSLSQRVTQVEKLLNKEGKKERRGR